MPSDIMDVFAEAADGVYAVDMNQRIVFWNRGAERILGYGAAEMLGRACYEVFGGPSEDGELQCTSNCASVLQARRGQVAPSQKVFAHPKEGKPRWISITHVLMPAVRRELGTLVHIFHDVSEEVEAKRLVKHLGSLLANSPPLPVPPESTGPETVNTLSPRELEVIRLLGQGMSTGAIADSLVISPTTVRNHVQRILVKLGVHSRLESVVAASRLGLI